MKRKKILFSVSICLILIALFTISVIQANSYQDKESMVTNAGVTLSNKKIGWGIKREKDHKQPDVGTTNKRLLDQYEGICLGNSSSKKVYLTFDEGYEAGYTPKLLETLKQNDVKATFFITAHFLNTQEDLVKQMIEEGHIVGNHTVNHKSMPELSQEELKDEVMKLHQAIYDKTGYEMKYIRPPKGEFSERTLDATNRLQYKTVMWSLAYDDWDEKHQKGESYAKEKILENIHPGAVILLHGNSKNNADVLDACIKEIKNMGYEFKSLDEFER